MLVVYTLAFFNFANPDCFAIAVGSGVAGNCSCAAFCLRVVIFDLVFVCACVTMSFRVVFCGLASFACRIWIILVATCTLHCVNLFAFMFLSCLVVLFVCLRTTALRVHPAVTRLTVYRRP